MPLYSDLEHKHELASEATRVVRNNVNKVYSPVLTTEEVASHLGVDVSTTLDALTTSHEVGYLSRKQVGDDGEYFVWW